MEDQINLKDLFKTDKDFEKELKSLEKEVKKIFSYEGHILESPESLYNFLVFDTLISKRLERLYLYAHINNDLDLTNQKYQDYLGKVLNLANNISEKSSFVLPELLTKDFNDILKMIKKYPKLKEYKNNLKDIYRNKKLIKNKDEEKIISILTSTYDKPEDISEFLLTTDLDYGFIIDENGKKNKLTLSNFSTYLESNNSNVRKDAFEGIYKNIKAFENTFNAIFTSKIMENNKLSKIRGYDSARKLSLYQNNIKNNIYDKLIEGIHKNLNKFYKYYDFKKEVLNIKDFHIYDTYANITSNFNKDFSLEEAKNIIISSLSILGNDYIDIIKKSFSDNWISYYPKKNKRDGGYCTCAYLAHPYIVINYENKLEDVSTLAHELGHAMHYYYAKENNTYEDYNYSIFVAEVASQVNEIILTDYLLNNADNIEEKKYLLDSILKRFKATMIRQTMFAEFEDILHTKENEGIILTKDVVQNTYYDLNKLYFGENVIIDDYIKYECYRIPHFYYNFYVYQYATGYAAALKIAHDIINKKAGALEKYRKFLTLGSTLDPVKSLGVAGVDMLDDKLYDEVFTYFDNYLKELKKLYE